MNIVRLVPDCSNPDDMITRFCAKSIKFPYSVELIYLPFVLFWYKIEMSGFFSRKKNEKGLFMVDLIQGIPVNIKKNTRFKVEEGLKKDFDIFSDLFTFRESNKTKTISIESKKVEADKILPAVIDKMTAIKMGKKLLRYDIMRLTGSLRYRRIDIIPYPDTRVLYYPYWVIYYRNKQAQMKFVVLDGLSGQKEGGQIVHSIEIGLVKKHKEDEELNSITGASIIEKKKL